MLLKLKKSFMKKVVYFTTVLAAMQNLLLKVDLLFYSSEAKLSLPLLFVPLKLLTVA